MAVSEPMGLISMVFRVSGVLRELDSFRCCGREVWLFIIGIIIRATGTNRYPH